MKFKYYYLNDPTNMGQDSIGANNDPLYKGAKEVTLEELKNILYKGDDYVGTKEYVGINIANLNEEEFEILDDLVYLGKCKGHLSLYTK